MKTRQEMIQALTRFELQYLMDNPHLLDDVAKFFANGGYVNQTDEKLWEHYLFQFEGEQA
jgi:hypothetical protein